MDPERKVKPKVEKGKVLGKAVAGTFAGTRTLEDGTTEKVIVDDIGLDGELPLPPDIDNPICLGAVKVTTTEDVDYTPRYVGPRRLRTFEKVIRTTEEPLEVGRPKA